MARVVLWLPQLAGAGTLRAGWPGSNGSTIGMNAAAGAVAAAVWLDAGAALAGALPDAGALWVAPPLAEDPEPPQPASTPTAGAAAGRRPRRGGPRPAAASGPPRRDGGDGQCRQPPGVHQVPRPV